MRSSIAPALLLVAAAVVSLPAHAGGPSGAIGVSGKKLLVKNTVPDDESRNKIIVVAKDAAIAIPAPGSLADPRCGASATSVVVVGIDFHSTPLACENWTLLGGETAPKGYRYKDPELDDGTALSVIWKAGRFKIVLTGKGPTYLSTELSPGVPVPAFEVTLFAFGNPANGYCIRCTPFRGRDGSDGKRFVGNASTCPAPTVCFSSPSGAFLDDAPW